MGQEGSAELAFWLVAAAADVVGSEVFEAVLVALADHGHRRRAARLTYLSAPDLLQGAGGGLLGGGSRFLGVTEDCGQFLAVLVDVQATCRPTTPDGTRWPWPP